MALIPIPGTQYVCACFLQTRDDINILRGNGMPWVLCLVSLKREPISTQTPPPKVHSGTTIVAFLFEESSFLMTEQTQKMYVITIYTNTFP